ncbi:uncharacterized protein [Triticum aestivum]|uniref:uncharacterized protein isoform X1 n=2 Tax=Triticum aestivum TaxID=4565 RepID=UPI001D013F1C|nr:uncharacterized protein LOC123102787 isoform X1 [Triticum aestivum]
MSMDIVIMVTLSQCIIFGSHIPQGAPFSDSMSGDLRNKRRNNPAEEFGEEEQEKNTFILIGMETPVRIECIIANQLLCMVSGHACLFPRLQLTCWMGNNQICGQRQSSSQGVVFRIYTQKRKLFLYRTKLYDVIDHYF